MVIMISIKKHRYERAWNAKEKTASRAGNMRKCEAHATYPRPLPPGRSDNVARKHFRSVARLSTAQPGSHNPASNRMKLKIFEGHRHFIKP